MHKDGHEDDIETRKIYRSSFPDFDLHHIVPRSRLGNSEEFNLFPYKGRPHSDYHHILMNLKINQLWSMRRRIHASIFESAEDYIVPWWLEFCRLDTGSDKKKMSFEKEKNNKLEKGAYVSNLQENWVNAFGGPDLVTAEEFLKLMMLFMVFGTELLSKDTLFDNGNLVDFIESTPCTQNRLWAFERCFGQAGTSHSLKSKIVSIVDRFDYYSAVIL